MRMSPWGRSGGVDSRLGSFSKRRWKNKPPVPDSPTTVLSAESSTESSSTTSSDSEMVARIRGTPAPACSFEAINSNTWTVSTDRRSDLQVEVNDVTFHLHKVRASLPNPVSVNAVKICCHCVSSRLYA